MVPEFPVDATFETFQPTAEEKKGWGPAAMREKWAEGPWQGEADKVVWIDPTSGLDCIRQG